MIFELYNDDGSLQLDLASRLSKYLGSVNITRGVPGSLVNDDLREGTPWYSYLGTSSNFRDNMPPTVTFSDNRMSWDNGGGGPTEVAIIIYGVYSNGGN